MNSVYREMLVDISRRLDQSAHGEKGKILVEAQQKLGISRDTLYRDLQKIGWTSGRKRRADAGNTKVDDEALHMALAMGQIGKRANGKQIIHTTEAHSILTANGYKCASPSTFRRQLRELKFNNSLLNSPSAHQEQRSLHPNHVHQLDPSLCLLYYPPGGKGKRQKYADDDDFYKNKPQNLEKIKHFRVWRYVLVDHYSGLVLVRYYEAAGENQQINFDFLQWCWRQIGLPKILVTDKGSANIGKGISRFTRQLGVEVLTHEAGNPRAKGGVENANNVVETKFESRLLLEPVESVDELNKSVEAWQKAFNADMLPSGGCKHKRHGKSRLSVWQHIMRAENHCHYRVLPDEQICGYLMTKDPESRKVKQNLTISISHPLVKRSLSYDVSDLADVYVGLKVVVAPVLVGDKATALVGVEGQFNVVWHEVTPIDFDEAGFRADAAVIGEEYKQKPETTLDKNRKLADQIAYPGLSEDEIKKAKKKKAVPFNGEIDAHSHLKEIEVPAVMTPVGEQVEVPEFSKPVDDSPTIDNRTLRRRVADALYRPLEKPEADYLKKLGDVPESEVTAITARVAEGISAPVIQLRNVNEG